MRMRMRTIRENESARAFRRLRIWRATIPCQAPLRLEDPWQALQLLRGQGLLFASGLEVCQGGGRDGGCHSAGSGAAPKPQFAFCAARRREGDKRVYSANERAVEGVDSDSKVR